MLQGAQVVGSQFVKVAQTEDSGEDLETSAVLGHDAVAAPLPERRSITVPFCCGLLAGLCIGIPVCRMLLPAPHPVKSSGITNSSETQASKVLTTATSSTTVLATGSMSAAKTVSEMLPSIATATEVAHSSSTSSSPIQSSPSSTTAKTKIITSTVNYTAKITTDTSPTWTLGSWVPWDGPEAKSPYDLETCARELPDVGSLTYVKAGLLNKSYKVKRIRLWQPHWPGLTSEDRARPTNAIIGRLRGPWSVPSVEELMEVLRGRQIVIIGDSMSSQQWTALICLLVCRRKATGDRLPYRLRGLTIYFPSIGAQLAHLGGGEIIVRHTLKERGPTDESWYLNEKGEKTAMRHQKFVREVDMAHLMPPDGLKAWASVPNVTIVVNAGGWVRSKRSDVLYTGYNGNVMPRMPSEEERLIIFRNIVAFMAGWYDRNLGKGSTVAWLHHSLLHSEPSFCTKDLHPWARAGLDGLRDSKLSTTSPNNFFVRIDCASAGDNGHDIWRRSPGDNHFAFPGVPDYENFFVLRLLAEQGRR